MASRDGRRRGARSPGLLVWLLLLQPGLGKAPAGGSAPPAPSPTPSWGGPRALPPGEAQGVPEAPKPQKTASGFDVVDFSTVCGQVVLRILGGDSVQEGEWPWQASLRVNGRHVCGGTLITRQWVLTAGHCILSAFYYTVKLGDRSVHEISSSVVIPVKSAVVHPRFSVVGTIQHDLALLQLLYPVNFTVTIQPICIPEETFLVAVGTKCWVTGWGRTQEFGGELVSYNLQKIDQRIIYYKNCNQLVMKAMGASKDKVLKGMICGYKGEGMDSCQGDSGGPLVCQFNDTWVQVGIVSWGAGCGRRNTPGVYTDVAFYSKWILAVVNQAVSSYPVLFLVPALCLVPPLGILATL